jgi:hypothetical protein
MSVKVGTLYSDKEFCNDDTISALTNLKIKVALRTPLQGGCPTITDSNKLTVIFVKLELFSF